MSSYISKTKKVKSKLDDGKQPINYFIPQSRLSRGQRKYCHCIMKMRGAIKSKKNKKVLNPYNMCSNIIKKSVNDYKIKNKLSANGYNPYIFNSNKTNCVMNYNYTNYKLKDIQEFCKEKGIDISYTMDDGITQKKYKKEKLIEKLVKHYLNKKGL